MFRRDMCPIHCATVLHQQQPLRVLQFTPLPPQHQAGDATSKLQLMHLKAAAQMIGVEGGSLGWMMLERLVLDSEVGDEWSDIWSAITSGKV